MPMKILTGAFPPGNFQSWELSPPEFLLPATSAISEWLPLKFELVFTIVIHGY